MLRSQRTLLKRSSFYLNRRFSTLLTTKPIEKLIIEDLSQPSINQHDVIGRLKLIESIQNTPTLSTNNRNQLLEFLIPNFSFYFKLPQHIIKQEVLHRLIQLNPGRVHSTLDLYNNHRNEIQDYMINDILNKLIHGEKKNITTEEEKGTDNIDLNNIIQIVNDYQHLQFDQLLIELFYKLIDNNDNELIVELINSGILNGEIILKEMISQGNIKTSSISTKFAFITIFNQLFINNPKSIDYQIYTIVLNLLNFGDSHKQLLDVISKYTTTRTISTSNEILQFVIDSKLDEIPEAINLRQTLLEIYGIKQQDNDKALKKYFYYETHVKTNIEHIRFIMVKIFSYLAIKQNNEIWNQVAQLMINPELTIKTLQLLIIGKSFFNIDSGLSIYNDYIQNVSSQINPETKKSSKGLLTESIILGFLINNDREFASLIFEKAIENQIIVDELEISQIKKLFKTYSDCFIDNEVWEDNAQLKMINVALEYIENIDSIKY